MAKSQRNLKGWEYFLELEEKNSGVDPPAGRRSRRGRNTVEKIKLKRDVDQLEIKAGDSVIVEQKGMEAQVAFINDIRFGNNNFLDIIVAWCIKIDDVDRNELYKISDYSNSSQLIKNEIFITSYLEEVQLAEIVNKATVVSFEELNKEIVIDGSNSDTTFMCRRGCDSEGENFSEEFDFRTLLVLFHKDNNEFIEFIRSRTVSKAYSDKKKTDSEKSEKTIETHLKNAEKKTKGTKRKYNQEDVISDDDRDVLEDITSNESDDDKFSHEDDDDDEVEVSAKSKLKEPSGNKTPTRKRRNAKQSKKDDSSREYMNFVLSPFKKRLNVRQDLSKPSLSSISPKKKNSSTLAVDTSSKVFKELKAKLSTGAKLSTLPCREDEFTSIYLNLESTIEANAGCCLYISGTPGVGKTATVREVISQLQEMSDAGELQPFDYLEINGLKLLSPNVAYEVLWEKISGLKVSSTNAALLLENHFSQEAKRKPLVVLMDELDQIVTKKQNVMYNFFNWPTYPHSSLIVIALANTMDLPERVLTNKISSRLGLRRIQFTGYTYEQLGIIIKHRLEMISKQYRHEVVVTPDAIGFASRKVASISGDARRALTICRRAAEIAEQDFVSSKKKDNKEAGDDVCYIQISHVSKAINETVSSPTYQFVNSLPFASKLFLAAVVTKMKRSGLAENTLGDILDEMKKSLVMLTSAESNRELSAVNQGIALNDILYSTGLFISPGNLNIRIANFKQILNELVEAGIIVQQNTRSERYRLINLNVSDKEVVSVLKKDKDIGGLL